MELLEAFYRRKLRKKQKKPELGRSDGALCRSPSEASVNSLATGLISRVLRFTSRRSEPASRPHSWHSTKLGEGQQELGKGVMDTMSSNWHHGYHASASTIDLSGGFDSGGSYLRKSPDQYSSRGSMESLDPPHSSQLHCGVQHQHPLGHHGHSGSHPTYSSCHQLSSARSSNSIDHLHSKRDSAYSSFSTSSSIPEYLASTPSFSPERSYSLETVPQRGGGSGEMQQADIRYIRAVYDTQQGQDHELSSTSATLQHNSEPRGGCGVRPGPSQDHQGSVGGGSYHCSSGSSGGSNVGAPASNRHSVGSLWGPATSHSSYESLKGAPAPPRRSDSYAAIRNHERPNSWSSLEHARSLRPLQKGSWHHSSGPVASAKGSYGAEGQLHTVIEKSPESSPTTKPRQGGGFPQPLSPTGPSPGPAGSTPQSGRVILPTSVYPILQAEPHYAQMPSSSPSPGPPRVYPGQQGLSDAAGRDEGATEGVRDLRTTTENGYPHSSYSPSASTQLRTQTHVAERHQQEDCNFEPYRTQKTTGGESESQTGLQRLPNDQGPYNRSFQGPHIYTSQGPHSQVYQEQNQHFYIHQIHAAPDLRPPSSQEKSEPYTAVQPWGDRRRSVDQISIHSEPVTYSKPAHGQMPLSHSHVHPQPPPIYTSQSSSRHLSDSAALQYQHWDHKEHPLTRLENALAEVQQCASPDTVDSASSHSNSSISDCSKGPVRSLSVLEKVSRFERREHAGKQRCHSTSTSHSKSTHQRMTEKGRSSPCGAEDLRHMLERSTKGTKAHRTMSYRGGSSEQMKYRSQADPCLALQRSRSTFQVDGSIEGDRSKDFPWKQEIQEMLGPLQDMNSNRSYRDSLKDAQSKVLRSTSFRRRDLSSSLSSPPPVALPTVSSSSSHQPQPILAKYPSLEKKGPKTMPKPVGVIVTSQSPPPVTSPHTPKERHVVCPDVRGPSPPPLPSVPPVGPPAPFRICGRKRLTVDQKKRSYSEPENMNEVGVLDAETLALFRRGGETSVADRRKMFELAANRVGSGAPQNATSKPDLRQVQQDALAEYMERKRGVKRDEGGHRSGSRPRSAYLHPDNSNQIDTLSLSSTSSMLSLQDSGPDRGFSSVERRLCSTVPSDTDLQTLPSNFFYPGRVTTPRPPAQPPPSSPGSTLQLQTQIHQDLTPEAGISRQRQSSSSLGNMQQGGESQFNLGLSKQLDSALLRAGSTQNSGMSASAENLLDRSEDRQNFPQHHRSRSSPTAERLNQDLVPGDVRTFGVFIAEPGRCALAADGPSDIHVPEDLASPQPSQWDGCVNTFQPAGPSQDPGYSHTPVTRRERQRNSERQRAHSTSTLAASVGLPCPFTPPGSQDREVPEWQISERLSQANLDAITFPDTGESDSDGSNAAAVGTTSNRETQVMDRQTRHSLSDATILEDTAKDMYRSRAYSLEQKRGHSAENTKTPMLLPHFLPVASPNDKGSGCTTSSPTPISNLSIHHHLSSLRISESSLVGSNDQQLPLEISTGTPQEDFDEVFLQNPTLPPPSPPIEETIIMEDFPPPPPPVELEQEAEQPTVTSSSSEILSNSIIPTKTTSLQSSPAIPAPAVISPFVPSFVPSIRPQLPSTITTSSTAEDHIRLEYQPLPKREKTSEELRVEALARQLVLQDPSLTPLLDTWGGKSTVEIMEEVFPNSRLTGKSQWQHRGSTRGDERIQDGVFDPAQSTFTDQGEETSLDNEKKDLNTRKVELCEALRISVAGLQQEKEALREEQRHHQALGDTIEALVQEHLKPNERDKYNMFIGDLDKIVNLLLSLCSRLSRIDRSLLALQKDKLISEDAAEEKESLLHKRSLLLRQTEDARELKENLDRRQRVVHAILSGYLTEPLLQDYRHFVSAKPSFLIRQRHLDDLIRQEEEQLTRLVESLPVELAEAHGWSAAYSFLSSYSSPFPTPLPPSVISAHAHSVRSTTVTSL